MHSIVLGIGNNLLSDEGVGVHAIRSLQEQYTQDNSRSRPRIDFLDGGTLSFTLSAPLSEANNLVVIDAAELHQSPGAIAVFEGDDMDKFLTTGKARSVHELSLFDLMSMLRLSGNLPEHRALIGIQPKLVDWGEHCTAPVRDALPRVCQIALALLDKWNT